MEAMLQIACKTEGLGHHLGTHTMGGASDTETRQHICLYVYLYICIYIYVCIFVSMYLCICVSMYICIYVYLYLCIYVSCIYVYMYICIYVYMYICINVYMYICIYVYMHMPHTCWLLSCALIHAQLVVAHCPPLCSAS